MKRERQQWLPSIFNDFFNSDILVRNSSTAPAINVFETEKEYKVEVAAAGMCKDDFKISIDGDNDLTITMEKNCSSDNCNCGCEKEKEEKEKKADEKCECKDDKKCDDKCEEHKCDEKKEEEKKHEQGRFLRREFSYTRFQQTLVLPEDADTTKIEAKVKHGVLRIHIPKKANMPAEKSVRTIAIE